MSINQINSLNPNAGLINGDFKTINAESISISGTLDMEGNPIIGLPLIPIDPTEATSKNYVDSQLSATDSLQQAYDVGLPDPTPSIITDGTIKALKIKTGTTDGDFVFKVIDTTNGTKFAIKGDGSTTTGEIDTVFNKIVNLAPGVNPGDAVNFSQLGGTGGDFVSKTTLTPQSIASTLTTNGTVVMNTGALQIQGSTVQIQNSGSCQIQPTGPLSLKDFSTTGNITMGGSAQIKNLANGTLSTDAVNLSQIPSPVSLTDLETKTQNIDLTTLPGNTDISGTITVDGELTIPVVASRGVDNYIVGGGGTSITSGVSNMVYGNGSSVFTDPAGNALTTGRANVLIGASAGKSIDSASFNTIIGNNCGVNIVDGRFNTMVGHSIGNLGAIPLTSAEDNVLIGSFSQVDDNTNFNVVVGEGIAGGSGSIAIGFNTSAKFINSIALGLNATAIADNQMMIGNIGEIVPQTSCDLGSTLNKFNNLLLSGEALIDGAIQGASLGFGAEGIKIGTGPWTTQDSGAIAIGNDAGQITQGIDAVSVGKSSGFTTQGDGAVAIGLIAGNNSQTQGAVAIGCRAGQTSQGLQAVAIGEQAGNSLQQQYAVAIGFNAGGDSIGLIGQGDSAVAIGKQAGQVFQGANAIAIGSIAGNSNQASKSIVINATGLGLQNTVSDSCVIAPIRSIADPIGLSQLVYNTTTKEVQYTDGISGAEYYWNSNITYSTPNPGIDTFGPVWASPSPLAQAGLSTSDWTFTAQTAELQYTGTTTRIFSINANWSWEMGLTAATAQDVQINLAVNGTPQAKLQAYTRLNDALNNYPRNSGMCGFISLAPNDTIRMYAKIVTNATETHWYRNFNFIIKNI